LIYGRTVFTAFEHYWWIPVVAPIFGCLFGGAVWTALVGEDEGELEI
jgi:glycerol uptake facilitator-like aquaporin